MSAHGVSVTPSLRVLRSDQVYGTAGAVTPGTVRYASLGGDFTAELTVDANGFVVDSPHLARRVRIG
ncbi:putative glycolipid-binding domain-containing protein [Arthrobacter sp. Ld5]|uniref:putative glycolipid-binding domain-containing protein n=1 Tax=Arthrobacter sp. Ld5 TaxID=649152 RepID=UPI003EB77449